jgi:hypothetical protein
MIESGQVFAARYKLASQLVSHTGIPAWKADDTLLKRAVCVYLLDKNDPRANQLIKAALIASKRNERDSISILDVIDGAELTNNENKFVGIVSEWVTGPSLGQRLLTIETFTSSEALILISQLAVALNQSHSQNVTHGRLRPHNIIFADSDEVRISGFGIDTPLLGGDQTSGVQADICGLGNVLFAAVTGMWPNASADGLPPADTSDKLSIPSNFRSGVTNTVDSIYRRTQDGTFTSMYEVMHALSIGAVQNQKESLRTIDRLSDYVVTWHGHPESKSDRKRATLFATCGVLLLAWVGFKLMSTNLGDSAMPEAIISPLAAVSPTPISSDMNTGETAEIQSVSTFDPFGDNTENDNAVGNVVDGDSKTKWTTVAYKKEDLGGKPGVGLILDLGAPRPVSSVNIAFASPGNDVTVYVTEQNNPDLKTATKLGEVNSAAENTVIKSPRPISGRYVVVWLTKVPQSGAAWKSGIFEITVKL